MKTYQMGYFLLGFLTVWLQSYWFVPLLIGYDIIGLFFTTEKTIRRAIDFEDKQRWADTGIPFLALGIVLALAGLYLRSR